jgi:hypothetical protein
VKRSVWPGILGTVVALAMSGAAAAQPACGCTADDHAVKTLARYKHAFAGRVASVEAQDGAVSRVTFDVLRVWKG